MYFWCVVDLLHYINLKKLYGTYRIKEVRGFLIIRAFYYLIVYRYLKTFIIMAKFELKFLCESEDYSLKVSSDVLLEFNNEDKITNRTPVICLEIFEMFDKYRKHEIYLDKSTAIKFAKTLRTEINKITEIEGKHE